VLSYNINNKQLGEMYEKLYVTVVYGIGKCFAGIS
jgi:hypothetical protein